MGEVPSFLQRGVTRDVARRRRSVSDLAPCMNAWRSLSAALNVFFVSFARAVGSMSVLVPTGALRRREMFAMGIRDVGVGVVFFNSDVLVLVLIRSVFRFI